MNYLEKLKKIKRKIYIKTIITILIFLGFLILLMYDSGNLSNAFEILIFMLPLGFLFIKAIIKMLLAKDIRYYKKIYKENILLECLNNVFTDVKYSLPDDDFADTTLLPEKFVNVLEDIKIEGGITFNDYISAKYNNINFKCIDIKMNGEAGTHKGPSSGSQHTTFKGQWLVFELNKKIKINIQICENTFKGNKKNGLSSGKKYIETKTNDIEFDNQFKVFMENEVDISNILTPDIINKIKKLRNKLKVKLYLCFINNKLHVLIENKKDLFEPNIYKKIDLEQGKKTILEETKYITEFINILDLDNDIFN